MAAPPFVDEENCTLSATRTRSTSNDKDRIEYQTAFVPVIYEFNFQQVELPLFSRPLASACQFTLSISIVLYVAVDKNSLFVYIKEAFYYSYRLCKTLEIIKWKKNRNQLRCERRMKKKSEGLYNIECSNKSRDQHVIYDISPQ